MVIKEGSARTVLDLMGSRHREKDPDDEFLDRLAKKTSFYEQPSAPPETLNLPPAPGSAEETAAAAELDGLADVKIDDGSDEENAGDKDTVPRVVQVVEPAAPAGTDTAAAAAAHGKKVARFEALFEGRSGGGSDPTGVPENLKFAQLSRESVVQQLPAVGKAHLTPDEEAAAAEEAAEDAARRAAWAELNQLREEKGQTSSVYKRAHERFLATWGHKGAELRE